MQFQAKSMEIMKIIEFQLRITKIIEHLIIPKKNLYKLLKSKNSNARISKITKILEFHARVMKIMKICENHKRIMKIKKTI